MLTKLSHTSPPHACVHQHQAQRVRQHPVLPQSLSLQTMMTLPLFRLISLPLLMSFPMISPTPLARILPPLSRRVQVKEQPPLTLLKGISNILHLMESLPERSL